MEVMTKYGRIRGVLKGDALVYKGIPYAKPPVGELRFSPPQEPEAWDGVLDADKWPSKCMQFGHEPGSFYEKEFYADPEYLTEPSEDCLYLNIWTPADSAAKKLPVAFWIHGGAFWAVMEARSHLTVKNMHAEVLSSLRSITDAIFSGSSPAKSCLLSRAALPVTTEFSIRLLLCVGT